MNTRQDRKYATGKHLELFTYWTLGTKNMVGVEFLTGLGQLPEKAFFCSLRSRSRAATVALAVPSRFIDQVIRSAVCIKSKCLSPELFSRQPHYDGSDQP